MEPSTQDDARAPDTAAQSTRHSLVLKEAIDQAQQLLDDQTRVLGPDRQETLRTRGNVVGRPGRTSKRPGGKSDPAEAA